MQKHSQTLLVLCTIFLVALLIRVDSFYAHDEQRRSGLGPFGDSSGYHILASSLASGKGYLTIRPQLSLSEDMLHVDNDVVNFIPAFSRGPAYPFFISLVYRCFSAPQNPLKLEGWKKQWDTVRVIQCALDAACCFLIFFIVRLLWRGSAWPALCAAMLYAFSFYNIFYTRALLSETLATFLVTLFILVMILALKRSKIFIFLCAGAACGLIALCRPEYVLLCFVFAGIIAYLHWRRHERAFLKAFVFLLGALCVIAPWALRNYQVFHKPILISYGGVGESLYFGTLSITNKTWIDWTQIPDDKTIGSAEKEIASRLHRYYSWILSHGTIDEVQQFEEAYRALALERFLHEPVRTIRNWIGKIPRLWYQNYVTMYVGFDKEASGIFFIFYFLFAVYAFAKIGHEQRFLMLPIGVLFLYLNLIFLPLNIEPRYGVPFMPALISVAGIGCYHLVSRFRLRLPRIPNQISFPFVQPEAVKQKRANFFWALLIIATAFFIYANSIKGEFVWDDEILICDNVFVKNWSHLGEIFTSQIGTGSGEAYSAYRPLQLLTYVWNYTCYGMQPNGYHLYNILFHACAALMVWWFLWLISNNEILSVLAALLFVACPLHTSAVAYISGRADSLALIFMLLCMIFYLYFLRFHAERKKIKKYVLFTFMIASYLCALFSRESSIVLPALLFLYHKSFRIPLHKKAFFSLVALTCFYGVARVLFLPSLMPHHTAITTLLERLPGFFAAFAQYVRLLIFPSDLHMEYGNVIFAFYDSLTIIGATLVGMVGICLYRLYRRDTIVFFGLSWFLITFLPVSNLYPLSSYMAEHWLYMPSIGFFVLIVRVLTRTTIIWRRRFGIMLCVLFTIIYGVITIRQNYYWQDPARLYEKILAFNPDSLSALNNLGTYYMKIGTPKKAIPLFERAIAIDKTYVKGYSNLGTISIGFGDLDQAINFLKQGLSIESNNEKLYNNLGVAYHNKGAMNEALSSFKKAIELNRYCVEAYVNLAFLYEELGRLQEADQLFQTAFEIDPESVQRIKSSQLLLQLKPDKLSEQLWEYKKEIAVDKTNPYLLNNIACLYRLMKQDKEAISYFEQAIALNPRYIEAYYNLGNAYKAIGDYNKALAIFEKVITLDSGTVVAYSSLANTYRAMGNAKQAIVLLEKALTIDSRTASIYNDLGIAYFSQGEKEKAFFAFQQALAMNPRYEKTFYNLANAYELNGDNKKAEENYRHALRLKKDYGEAWYNLAMIYREAGRTQEAMSTLEGALKNVLYDVNIYSMLGKLYMESGQAQKAITTFEKLLFIDPRSGIAYAMLCHLYYRQKQYDKALACCEKAQQNGEDTTALSEIIKTYLNHSSQKK